MRRRAAAAGCVVIDNSSLYRYDPDVPLIVPEVNADAIEGYKKKNIIANPNCSTAQMVVALKPLHDRAQDQAGGGGDLSVGVRAPARKALTSFGIRPRASMFPVSGSARRRNSQADRLQRDPHIDVFLDDGSTKEEWKMVAETKKILDKSIRVTATCVRVPVFVGHSEAINIETEEFLDWEEAQDILREAPGVMLVDKREAGRLHHARSNASANMRPTLSAACGRIQHDRQRPEPCGLYQRQPAQGRGAERSADRRGSWKPVPEKGLILGYSSQVCIRGPITQRAGTLFRNRCRWHQRWRGLAQARLCTPRVWLKRHG